jgi:hypothetical protein
VPSAWAYAARVALAAGAFQQRSYPLQPDAVPALVVRAPDGSLSRIARTALEAFRVPEADRAAVEEALAEPDVTGYAQVDVFLPRVGWETVPAVVCRTAGAKQRGYDWHE